MAVATMPAIVTGQNRTSGSATRFNRLRMKAATPSRSSSDRPKKPASRKNTSIRNMCGT